MMPAPARPKLTSGNVYRTKYFSRFGRNPTRLASRLVSEGRLEKLANGLYFVPRESRFGKVPPGNSELMKAFLKGDRFLFTGPTGWNSLGLGSTSVSPTQLVYNRKRTGHFQLAGKPFELRRVDFPSPTPPEFFVVDLLENSATAGAERSSLERNLASALAEGRFNGDVLVEMAERYGSKHTQNTVAEALKGT